jgi:hypothetical protein
VAGPFPFCLGDAALARLHTLDAMDPTGQTRQPRSWLLWAMFVGSAGMMAAAIRASFHRPVLAAGLAGALVTWLALRLSSQRRARRVLRSGDVASVLARWSPELERVPHQATMAPLMTATAFAAYGWVDEARAALEHAARGPAWEAALEHRLFLDTLLLAFEGDAEAALEKAGRLERLPVPNAGGALQKRVVLLRGAASAFARAFAHRSRGGDAEVLARASRESPLVFWAMRYAAAVAAIDRGDGREARALIATAPAWPEQSSFRAFHREIAERAGAAS